MKLEQVKLPNYPYVTIFKIDKKEINKIDFALCKQPKETLEAYYNRQTTKPDLLINGGFFSLNSGETIFTYIDEGTIISKQDDLLDGMGVKDNQLILGTYDHSYKDFISGYPVLIKNGKAVITTIAKNLDYNARRSILGYNNNYVYVIGIDSPGMTFQKMKDMLLTIGVTDAINLDGGGSTRILKNGIKVTTESYSRPVDNVVAIYLKPVITTLYRVQTGAFSIRTNAEAYQKKIIALDDKIGAGYKNAYIRLIDGLYKVQVGAFSKKENAEKVVADLKAKGLDSFITTK